MQTHAQKTVRLYLFFAIFAASGFSGLIYESIWSHYLKLFLGHAAYAQTTVLAIFMGGMALGAGLAARFGGKWGNLLIAYALAEGLIGIAGLKFHGIFEAATAFAFDWALPRLESPTAIQLFKYSLGSLLILPQSILLGATFPLMSAGLIRMFPERSGSTLAMLYFTNSLGAVAGALTSALFLVEAVGLPGTLLTAGLINIVLALLVWLLGKGEPGLARTEPSGPITPAPDLPWVRLMLMVALLTGLSSFFYEIGWIRMLALVLGSSTRAFELMLAAFILGIALGGLWIKRRIDGLANPEAFLGYVQIAMGTAAAATLPLYGASFDLMAVALRTLQRNETGYAVYAAVNQGIAMAVMFPATFCAGMTLPLITHALLRGRVGERAIGQVYSANTIGAIAGVMLAVHALIPLIGVKGLILAGAVIDLGLGAFLLYRTRTTATLAPAWRYAGVVSAGLVLAVAVGHDPDPLRLVSSVYRHGSATLGKGYRVDFLRDGKTATVSLSKSPEGIVAIATNGKVDAGIDMTGSGRAAADEITMTLAGALALAHHPEARVFGNIGMGSGMTAHVLLGSQQPRSVDTIEIEPLMVQAARQGFGSRVPRTFDDPRSHIRIEDAKTFFSLHPRKFDAIISEPSNPWVSGVASLFSREFYRHIARYLNDDGILVQWLQAYETDIRIMASILNALGQEFSDYLVYAADDSDLVIVATKRGKVTDPDWNALSTPALLADLRRVGVRSVQDIRYSLIGDKQTLAPLLADAGAPINSDYFPFVEQHAPRALFLKKDAGELSQLTYAALPITEMLTDRPMNPTTEVPDDARRLSRTGVLLAALTVRDGTWETAPVISGSLRKVLKVLELSARDCPAAADPIWLSALHDAAALVLTQLRPEELSKLFDRWVPAACAAKLSPDQRQWVDLYKAVARRDGEAMAALAQELLVTSEQIAGDKRHFLLGAGMLGWLASDRKEDALALWKRYAPMVLNGQPPPIALRLLAAKALQHS